jgi:Family of unknown function (DUF6412)
MSGALCSGGPVKRAMAADERGCHNGNDGRCPPMARTRLPVQWRAGAHVARRLRRRAVPRTADAGCPEEVTVLMTPLGGLLAQMTGHGQLAGHLIVTPPALMALAAAAVACVIAGILARSARTAQTGAVIPLRSRATALRARSRRTAVVRQRDPDAAGRRRPRAPAASQAAA